MNEEIVKDETEEVFVLCLYIAGITPRSETALANLKAYCEENLAPHYTIEVVDLLEHPQLAQQEQILAVPTVIRKLPKPVRKAIGDFSNSERMLVGLGLYKKKSKATVR